jgi:hypothetical protein
MTAIETLRDDLVWAGTDLDTLAGVLVGCAAHETVAKHRFLCALAEFVARDGHHRWGCVTPIQWLSWKCGLGTVAASEHVRVAAALTRLPAISAAMASGQLSWSKVRAVTRIAQPATDTAWAELATAGTAAHVERMVRAQRSVTGEQTARQHTARSLTWRQDHPAVEGTSDAVADGSVVFTLRLPAETAATLIAAINAAVTPVADEPIAATRADTLVALATSDTTAHVTTITYTTQPDRSGEPCGQSADGIAVAAETIAAACCDGTTNEIIHQPDGTVTVTDHRRNPTPRIRRLVEARDPTCRCPGCHHTGHLDIHHLHHYSNGGSREPVPCQGCETDSARWGL